MPNSLFALGIIFSLLAGFFFGYSWGVAGLCFIIGLQVFWPKVLALFSPQPRKTVLRKVIQTESERKAETNALFDDLFANDPEYGPELALSRLSADETRRLFGSDSATHGEIGPAAKSPIEEEGDPIRVWLHHSERPLPTFKSRRTVADTPETMSIAWYLELQSPRRYKAL